MALLKVEQLSIVFPDSRKGGGQPSVAAVSDLTFKVRHGQTLCLVGESGSGKSLTARAVMGLLPQAAHMTGQILFDSVPLFENGIAHQGHRYCGNGMAMVFQEPLASLTPSMTVENLVGEAWRYRTHSTREVTMRRVVETLAQVGVPEPEALLSRYPWQLSGGLAQRVLIASALILEPRILIADEPTTALDVTTQARILELLSHLGIRRGLAMLFITHDLAIASLMGGNVLVLLRGRAVERGPAADLFANPLHPYTRLLVSCTPALALREGRKRLSPGFPDEGTDRGGGSDAADSPPASPSQAPGISGPGCGFAARCPRQLPICWREVPPEFRYGPRMVACFHAHPPADGEVPG